MTAFERAFNDLILIEGGYADHPSDRGGRTMYGITERVARANGYVGQMPDMTPDQARDIYRSQYWTLLALDRVAVASESVAFELFDTGVNMGTWIAAEFLQRALNALNRRGSIYADLVVDGVLGPMTVAALINFLNARKPDGERVMMLALNCLQGVRYIGIAEGDVTQEDHVYGWFRQRVEI